MRPLFLFFIIISFLAAGCATTQMQSDMQELQLKVSSLEKQIRSKDDEQAALQENQGRLELALKKQLEANLALRQKLDEAQKKADSLERQMEANKTRMPSAKDIQLALKNAGFYNGEIDGSIGPQTKDAVKAFQEANKLNPDGVVGSRTWVLLEKYLSETVK